MAWQASKAVGFLRPRWMAVGLVVALIGLPWVGLVKVWRLTPAGFVPAVRVSLLDLVQAWSLKRSAARHVARGQVEEALDCWRMAFANNPADIGVLRTWLGTLVRDESLAAARRGGMQGSVEWLLSLGGTNSANLDLALGVLERTGDVKQVLAMGARWKDRLGVEGQGWMARAYFDEGDMARFDLAWQGHAAAFEQDPELALYRDAWRAHWGPVATLREGRARLEAAMGRPELRRLALRLGLHVAHAREDAREYGRLLGILSAEGAAEASYHVSYWTLLALNGQKEAARTLAEGGLVEPMTLLEVQGLAKVLVSLGLGPRALSMLEVNRPRFRHHTAFWLVEARCLMELRKWKEMEDLGRAFRGDPSVDPTNIGVGWGIEAVSAHGLGKAEEARDLGRKMLLGVPKSPEVCGALAMLLTDARLDHLALATIRLLEPHGMDDPGYWRQRTLVASQTQDAFELVRCSTERFSLEPNDILARNMHAAVLLMARQNPSEAVRLTFQNMAVLPMNPDVRLNHAMALAFNGRTREAAAILEGTPVRTLSATQRNHYHLAWFDVHVAQQDWDKARERFRLMDQRLLLPLQRQRVQADLDRAPK